MVMEFGLVHILISKHLRQHEQRLSHSRLIDNFILVSRVDLYKIDTQLLRVFYYFLLGLTYLQ